MKNVIPGLRRGHERMKGNEVNEALSFMCIFNGLRVPQIRRFERSQKQISFIPLKKLDPELDAPEAHEELNDRYKEILHTNVKLMIDPSTTEVLSAVSECAKGTTNEYTLLHYYGQGSIPPTENGEIYFFDNKRHTYQPLPLYKIIDPISPTVMIIDCSSAGTLLPAIQEITNNNLFIFMSCGDGEKLPCALDYPMDILSSAILCPLETALWYHEKGLEEQEFPSYLLDLLNAFIDTIAQQELPEEQFLILFRSNKSLTSVSRGFVLASRILNSMGVHPLAFPSIELPTRSSVWNLWDMIIDFCLSCPGETETNLFTQMATTMEYQPDLIYMPLVCYFLQRPNFSNSAIQLLNSLITSVEISRIWCIDVLEQIGQLNSPKSVHLDLISKMIKVNKQITKSAFRAIPLSCQLKLLDLCASNAEKCAPCAGMIFSMISQGMKSITPSSQYFDTFASLITSPQPEVRASSIVAIAMTNDFRAIPLIIHATHDVDEYVVEKSLAALEFAIRCSDCCRFAGLILECLEFALSNPSERIMSLMNTIKPGFNSFLKRIGARIDETNRIIRVSRKSIEVPMYQISSSKVSIMS